MPNYTRMELGILRGRKAEERKESGFHEVAGHFSEGGESDMEDETAGTISRYGYGDAEELADGRLRGR